MKKPNTKLTWAMIMSFFSPAIAPEVHDTAKKAYDIFFHKKNTIEYNIGSEAYAADEAEAAINRRLPDLSNAKYLGEKGPYDKLSGIAGNETIITGYQLQDKWITLYSLPNKKVYDFGITDIKTKEKQWFWDYEHDGIFEQNDKAGNINLKSYGY